VSGCVCLSRGFFVVICAIVAWSHVCPPPPPQICMHTSLSLSLVFSLSLSFAHLSRSLTQSRAHSCTHARARARTHTHTRTLLHTLTLSLTHTRTRTHTPTQVFCVNEPTGFGLFCESIVSLYPHIVFLIILCVSCYVCAPFICRAIMGM